LGYIEVVGVFSPGATDFAQGKKCRKFFKLRPATFARTTMFRLERKRGLLSGAFLPGATDFRPGERPFTGPAMSLSPGRKFHALVFKYFRAPSEGLASLSLQPSLRRHPLPSWISCLNLHFLPFISV